MNKKIKVILFDLGNTLIYFDGCWQEILGESYFSLAEALIARGIYVDRDSFPVAFKDRMSRYFAEREITLVEETAGKVLASLLAEKGFYNVPEEDLQFALDSMYRVTEDRWRLEVDAIPTLEFLCREGYRLGLVSNAADARDVERLVEGFRLQTYFAEILISAAVGVRKPHPQIFQYALRGLGAVPRETMMVGDALQADILGANRMGIESVWLTRRVGFPGSEDLQEETRPDHVIGTLGELVDLLETPVSL